MAKRRHKNNRPMPVVRVGELATPERRQQLGGVMTEVVDRDTAGRAYIKRHRARIECTLDSYFQANRISDRQMMAGLKYREMFLNSFYGCNFKILCSPFLLKAGKGDAEGRILAHLDCERLLQDADGCLSEKELVIVRNVCGYDQYAGGRDNKRILVRALDKLAKYWGYI